MNSALRSRFNTSARESLEFNSLGLSQRLWDSKVNAKYSHLMHVPKVWNEGWRPLGQHSGDCDDELPPRTFLNRLDIDDEENVLFFWSRSHSTFTKWERFKSEWTHFCYPSDDNNALVSEKYLLIFCEEVFLLFERMSV